MPNLLKLGLFEPGMFGSELDLYRKVAILALYQQAIPILSVGWSEIIVNMIFERFRASGVSGGKGKCVGEEIYGARVADSSLFSATSRMNSY